ncbi:MAG: two-component regulator propeller domain-containing protein, partial [Chitinophagales bacterium]
MLFFAACPFLNAQVNQSAFSNLLKEFESSKLYVNSIEQDKQGFIWFGTYKGLIRFDGVGYQRYLPNAGNIHSISDNEINVIFKDSRGNLWIGTRNGLNRYDYMRNDFERFLHNPDNTNSLCSNEVFDIAEDPQGKLWIGTLNGGLSIMTPDATSGSTTYNFTNCAHDSTDLHSLSGNSVSSICFDHSGIGYIGTNNGLNVIQETSIAKKGISFQSYINDSSNASSIASDNIYKIYCDSRNNIWLIAQFGMIDLLSAKSIASGQFNFQHFFSSIHQATGGTIKSTSMLFIDQQQNYWLSTFENGVYRFRISEDQQITDMINYHHDPVDQRSLGNGSVNTFFESKDHDIWVGTDEGASRWNPLQEKFNISQLPGSFISTSNVSAIAEDANGTIWMGSFDVDTLYAIVQPNSQLRKLALSENTHSANRKIYITYLLNATNGAVYAGSSVGVFIIDAKEKKLFLQQPVYRPHISNLQKNESSQSLVSNLVSCLVEDAYGNIWIATGMGISRYNPLSKKCDRILYSKLPNEMNPALIIRHLKVTGDSTVWAATDNGLYSINSKTLTYHSYQSREALPGSRFLFIHESNDQQLLWIGTDQGLLSFDLHSNQFKNYPRSGNDLTISSILEDKKGNLWISSQYGITRFQPETGDLKKFTVENGLNTNRFSENASCVAKDGLFYFGSDKGFQSFYPDSIPVNTTVPPVVITDFRLFNQSIFAGKEAPLVNDFLRSKKMTLKYNQNFFSIDFAALNYNDAEANTYAYQLVGIDKDWVMAGNSRTATYTNIAPDCYTFKVKGANNHGVWNDEGASLFLIITPPWWKTWWFYSLCTIAIVSALYALYRYRINQMR